MKKEDIDKYIGKQVLVSTISDFRLYGQLEYNTSKSYPESLYMISGTDTDYTYYIGPETVQDIKEQDE